MTERAILAALFGATQAAALGRLLLAAALLAPEGLVTLRVVTIFQTYSLYLMLGVPEILYLWRSRWLRQRGEAMTAQLSGFAMLMALAAGVLGGLGAALTLAIVYDAPPMVALAAAALTAGACLQIGYVSPSYLARGELVGRAAREFVAAAAGLTGVWILGRQWGLAGVIAGLAAGYGLAAGASGGAWRGVRPHISRELAREVIPPGVSQVGIQVGLMLLASLDIVLLSRWRHGDPELAFYVMAVALLTAVSGAAHAIAGPAIVNIIQDGDAEARGTGTLAHEAAGECARVSLLLAAATVAAAVGVSMLLPHYTGMYRWLPAVAVTCLATRLAYFPALHSIVTDRRRVVGGAIAAGLVLLLALLVGLGRAWRAPMPMVLWSGALAACGYASVLTSVVLGRASAGAVLPALAAFAAAMLAVSFATFNAWLEMPASVACVAVLCLLSSVTFLRVRGPLRWERVRFGLPGSLLDDALRSQAK